MQKPPAGDDSVGRMQFLLRLRRRGIIDAAVLRALDEVPREHFVEGPLAEGAYADQALPIACGQTISQPYVVAYMTEQLGVKPGTPRARGRHRLGLSGGGAVAARPRGGQPRALPHAGGGRAQPASTTLGYGNVEVVVGDGLVGAPERAPYDRIIVTAAAGDRAGGAGRPARRWRRDGAAAWGPHGGAQRWSS